MARKKCKGTELAVFKGREAKLNHVLFQILFLKDQLTIYEMHKEVKKCRGLTNTRYANVNLRVKILEKSRYIRKTGIRKTKAGFNASVYELTAKAYLASLFESVCLEDMIESLSETVAYSLIADVLNSV
jgi:hypothetical protein